MDTISIKLSESTQGETVDLRDIQLEDLQKRVGILEEQIKILKAEPKHGRWIEREEWFEFEPKPRKTVGCSECGHSMYSKHDTLNYCPKCGVRMDGGENNEIL